MVHKEVYLIKFFQIKKVNEIFLKQEVLKISFLLSKIK